jgi:hypothetical protein
MFTRFQAGAKMHIMDQNGPLVRIPPGAPGADFLRHIGSAYENEITVPRKSLQMNAELLRAYLTEHQDVLPFRYSFEVRMLGRKDMITKGSGAVSGILIGGEPHMISGGNGECYLTKSVRTAGGAHTEERTDVRRKRRIETDEWGDIKITRRKIPFTLPERLDACISFLESLFDEQIRLYSYDRAPTLHEILEEMSEGSGGDDFAVEEVHRRGPETRAELLKALSENSLRKFRPAIIQLLLLCFSGHETTKAIELFVEQQPAKERNAYLVLLAAFAQATTRLPDAGGPTSRST